MIIMPNGHDQNYLNSLVKENKHQAPKTKNTDSNMKLLWIPVIVPKIGTKLRKKGCKFICILATKLNKIMCNSKRKLLPSSYPGVYKLNCEAGKKYIGETRKVCSLDQLNIKKIAWQEKGNQLNIPKIVMDGLIDCM